MSEDLLTVSGVHKSFFGVPVLRDVSLAVGRGEVCGLVGENGAGKSTLMNIIGGVVSADVGELQWEGHTYEPRNPAQATRSGIAFIHQELSLFPNLSVGENLCLGAIPVRRILGVPFIDRRAVRARAVALLSAVELRVDPDKLVEDLSPGERQLVEIAKAIGSDARLIIFDEPTTSLTTREAERLFSIMERLRGRGISMIYISHILEDVLRLCDRVMVLRDGEVVGAGARTEFTLSNLITLMVGRSIEQLYPSRLRSADSELPDEISPIAASCSANRSHQSAIPLLDVRGISQPGIVANISFTLKRGEILGIAGLMGSGRSELARILFGLDPFERGEILLNGSPFDRPRPIESIRRGMGFLTENRRDEGLLMEASVADNMVLACLPAFATRGGWLGRQGMGEAVTRGAAGVGLECRSPARQVARTLSGGNQQKVVLAKWLMQRPALLILDEPTRGIDIGAKQEIYSLIDHLAQQGTGILLISSEIEELIGLCDRILVMSRGEIRGSVRREHFDREQILGMALGGNSA